MSDNLTKKPEKLASAVYLITSFFADEEPMKWKLRALASDLVSYSIVLKDGFSVEENMSVLGIRKTVSELKGLLLVAKNAGLVSDANYGIIFKELSSHMNILSLPTGMSEENGKTVISLESLDSSDEIGGQIAGRSQISLKDKNDNDPDKTGEDSSNEPSFKSLSSGEKSKLDEQFLANSGRKEKKPRKLKEFGAVSVKKNNRKSIIINLLKRKKEITIKDVTHLIDDCSEKTIQRELSSMVKGGILKKKGEKRWSRYTLA